MVLDGSQQIDECHPASGLLARLTLAVARLIAPDTVEAAQARLAKVPKVA